MPVIGLLIGRGVSGALGSASQLIGGGLLVAVGAQMAYKAIQGDDEPRLAGAPLGRLIVLAAGLSIDNLVIGFALGARDIPLVLAVVVIGAISVGMSLAGLELGRRLGERVEHLSELLGACVLVIVGVAILTGVL
jgi:manganese efflux pump family protein